MANTDGQIVLGLGIPKTVSQINADIQKLEKQLNQVKATGALDTSPTVKKMNAQISSLQSQLKTVDLSANLDTKGASVTSQQAGQQIGDGIADGIRDAGGRETGPGDKMGTEAAGRTRYAYADRPKPCRTPGKTRKSGRTL